MKKILVLLTLLTITAAAFAKTYTVDEIPNVHLADSSLFVTNPDGILSPEAESAANTELRKIRRTTSAEAVLVVVDAIDPDDIDGFATDLFEKWGLGKKDVDNGLLILVAKNQRKAAIRPGYGLEGVLPDITCGRILRDIMFPAFREGNFDGGIVAAVDATGRILTDPQYADEIRSNEADADFAVKDEDLGGFFRNYFIFAAIGAALMLLVLYGNIAGNKNKPLHQRYLAAAKLKPAFIALTVIGFGVPLIALLPLLFKLKNWRNTPRKCPNCGTTMNKVDEVHDNDYLTPAQDAEERLGSVDYDVWLCPNCGETDIEPYVTEGTSYQTCEQCGGRTSRWVRDRVVRNASVVAAGLGLHEYACAHCGHLTSRKYTIPKIVVAPPIVGRGGGRGGGFGGGSFGGGFGGGSTGGGGASGSW